MFRRLGVAWCIAVATLLVGVHSGSGAPATATPCVRCFVTAAYADFLDRAPTNPDLAREINRLADGRLTRAHLVADLAASPAWATATVVRLYAITLGRTGDPAGVRHWSDEIRSRQQTVAEVASMFYASSEYFNRTGGTTQLWLEDLYGKLLGRPADPAGDGYWTGVTATTGRAGVALRFFQSPESRGSRVAALYLRLLGRRGDAPGVAYWSSQIATTGDLVLAVNLAVSPEYETTAGRRYPLDSLVIQPLDPTIQARALTSDVADSYALAASGADVTASAPQSNVGANSRVAFAPAGGRPMLDEQSCATWSSETTARDQQGATLRLSSVDGVTRAISVTKNVWAGAPWIFNVHLWDTSAAEVGTQIAAFDLSSAFRQDPLVVPLPWTLCARVVAGTVSFVVWPASGPPARWDDPDHGGSVTLPSGWDHPGLAGWYIGHLEPGDRASFDFIATGPVPMTAQAGGHRWRPAPATHPRAPTSIASAA